MGNLFREVRQAVTARQAADVYGLEIDRHGKARCPWHEDTRPSLSFDPRTGRCKCFACNSGGDAIDLVAVLFGLSPLQAAQMIDRDFGLGIAEAASRPLSRAEIASAEERRQALEREKEERREAARQYSADCERIQGIERVLSHFTPATAQDNPVFSRLLREMSVRQDRVERYLYETKVM